MKNSGIEWIGEIPDSWEVKRVKDVFSLIGGCGFKDEFQGHLDGDYPFCKASDINGKDKFLDHAQNYVNQDIVDEQHYKVVPQYSILMSKIGEAMKKNHRKINTVPCIVDNNCQALCKKSNDDIIYLYYLFSQIDMIWFDNGGTIPNISNTKLLNFFIPDISVELQKRIAYHLDEKCGKIDELIVNQEKQIEKLKEYKQSVITEAVTKGLDKSVPMKDSGIEWIGNIPNHWNVCRIKSLADNSITDSFIDGDWIESPDITDEGIRYLTTGNVGDGVFKCQGNGYVSKDTFNRLNCKYAYPGDLVISRLNSPYGRSCILPDIEEEYVLAVDLVILRTQMEKRFICYSTQCVGYQHSVEDYARGTAMKRISRTNLGAVQILIPKLSEQKEIADYLDEKCGKIDRLIAIKQEKIEKLQEYKKSLIYEYVTGKKEVV